jgi:hypothetical protein
MQLTRRQAGISLITSLIVIALVSAVILIMTARTLGELRHSRDNSGVIQTLLLARGSAHLGQNYLYSDTFKGHINETVSSLTAGNSERWFFGDNTTGEPSQESIANDDDMTKFLTNLQTAIDGDLCNGARTQPNAATLPGASSQLSFTIHVTRTACGATLPSKVDLPLPRLVAGAARRGNAEPVIQTYAVPFVMIAEGKQGVYKRNLALQGEFRFNAGRSSFARYAYFTEEDAEADLWFSSNTLIDGPVHTNTNFRFDGIPWFGGQVTSAGCKTVTVVDGTKTCTATEKGGIFDTEGSGQIVLPTTPPYVYDDTAPDFKEGVAWNAEYVALPGNNQDQRNAAQGRSKTGTNLATQGILFTTDLDSLTLWTENPGGQILEANGVDANGVPLWTPAASAYQIIEGCKAGLCQKYRIDATKKMQLWNGSSWQDIPGSRPFNGVIYADGKVERLGGKERNPASSTDAAKAGPAIASFSQITIASDTDIRITNDLKYEKPPRSGIAIRNPDNTVTPPTDINDGAENVLGIYSQSGDILIGNGQSDDTLNAPDNVAVHASIMSGEKQIRVENFTTGMSRGNFQLIGGMIQTRRGAFNRFSGNTITSGYARTYTYDKRFLDGLTPPFFPTANDTGGEQVFIFSFGQREQVY